MADVEQSSRGTASVRFPNAATTREKAALRGSFDRRALHLAQRPTRRDEQGWAYFAAPGLQVRADLSRVDCDVSGTSVTLCQGSPRRRNTGTPLSVREAALEIERRDSASWDWLAGRFALVHLDLVARSATFVTDRFGVYPICYQTQDEHIHFSDRADSLRIAGASGVDLQSIYNYVYFHFIPAPRTIFQNVVRVEPAQVVRFAPEGLDRAIWWKPRFDPVFCPELGRLKSRFRDLVQKAVEREATTERVGSFLSGGTDSSTVAGMLGKITGRPTQTFSIGFNTIGYDEMSYARIAARHFGTDQHEYYLTPEDLLHSIPDVAAHYDQPFGNSSALPAYYCALRAKESGVEKLLAGDGGDELFGGNSRYAKQRIFEVYGGIPANFRSGVLEPLLVRQNWPRRIPLLKKLASYVEQASVPIPDRLETYNLLHRFGADTVFSERFLACVQRDEPIELQREVYGRQSEAALIDRMLAYDWRFTLADNDLVKVTGTSQLAGEAVGFPFLDDDLVDFSLHLAPELKLRGLTLRYFFKEALRGFLPDEILRKRKHGFGLPFGPWLVDHGPLRALTRDALERIAARGIIRPDLVRELFSVRLQQHAGYFAEMIWILMMLEHWLDATVPDFQV